IGAAELPNQAPPLIVQDSSFRGCMVGVGVLGFAGYGKPVPCENVLVRNNLFLDCGRSISLVGQVRRVQVVGNRILGATISALQFEHFAPGARDILLANNTVFESAAAFRLWDDRVKGTNIRLCNNLVLGAAEPDMLFWDSGGNQFQARGPGNGQLLHDAGWQLMNNWREGRRPTGVTAPEKAWIPPGPTDVVPTRIPVLSREVGDANFLRPARNSLLATKGAGETDPSLPSYVGAQPPKGIESWDWDRTWKARTPGHHQLLTVSKKEQDGGKYRTINDALKDAKPWATIRVLDDAIYPGRIILDDPEKHHGLCLEAPRHATIEMGPDDERALRLGGVADVRVAGFRFRTNKVPRASTLVSVSGRVPGVVLEGLDFRSDDAVFAIQLTNISAGNEN